MENFGKRSIRVLMQYLSTMEKISESMGCGATTLRLMDEELASPVAYYLAEELGYDCLYCTQDNMNYIEISWYRAKEGRTGRVIGVINETTFTVEQDVEEHKMFFPQDNTITAIKARTTSAENQFRGAVNALDNSATPEPVSDLFADGLYLPEVVERLKENGINVELVIENAFTLCYVRLSRAQGKGTMTFTDGTT